jgi:hypothetical protein
VDATRRIDMRQIDLGYEAWVHPGIDGILFGSEDRCRTAVKKEGLDESLVRYEDTRPTIREVAKMLNEDEGYIWDEGGISSFPIPENREAKWPEGRIKVFVVTGGSEGLYLHVEIAVPQPYASSKQVFAIIAKTLDCSIDKWYECWMSACRIARMLGA